MAYTEEVFTPPSQEAAFVGAQEQYALAVEVACWLGFPLSTIIAFCQGWFYQAQGMFGGDRHEGWHYHPPRHSWSPEMGRGFKLHFKTEDEAKGHGSRQRCGTDKFGFPIRHAAGKKTFLGYRTGDIVRAVIPSGKNQGTHVGRIAIRFRPSFKLLGFDVHPKYLTLLQRANGYSYAS